MILADKIIEERKKNGWSQEELSEKLNVSRQAVSKWEGAQSAPDLQRILQMAQLFGVTTDYLLKDDIEVSEQEGGCEEDDSENHVIKVSMEEANNYMQYQRESSSIISKGVFLCIISPISLIALAAFQEAGKIGVSENTAAGLGIIILLLLIALAVGLFITDGMRGKPYEYLENERIETQYGVDGLVKEREKEYQPIYTRTLCMGIIICILGVVPIFVSLILAGENDLAMIGGVCVLLLIEAVGVYLIVSTSIIQSGFEKLLQKGDFSKKKKAEKKRTDAVMSAYWLVAVAVYLGWSFATNDWAFTWIVWPVAGVLCPVVHIIANALIKR